MSKSRKLDERDLQTIKSLYDEGISISDIARQFGVANNTIRYHVNPRTKEIVLARRGSDKKDNRAKRCPKCRHKIEMHNNFCPNCGECVKTPEKLAAEDLETVVKAVQQFVPANEKDHLMDASRNAIRLLMKSVGG